jgi:hypothetical protein
MGSVAVGSSPGRWVVDGDTKRNGDSRLARVPKPLHCLRMTKVSRSVPDGACLGDPTGQ